MECLHESVATRLPAHRFISNLLADDGSPGDFVRINLVFNCGTVRHPQIELATAGGGEPRIICTEPARLRKAASFEERPSLKRSLGRRDSGSGC